MQMQRNMPTVGRATVHGATHIHLVRGGQSDEPIGHVKHVPILPPEEMQLGWSAWWRTVCKEVTLRARLCGVGFWRGLLGGGVFGVSRLHATVIRKDGSVEPYGLISTKFVTDAGVAFLVDDWDNNATDLTNLNFHGCGTGAAAENVTDTALGTESTTALNPDSTRATGTRSQPAANQYRSAGTLTFDVPAAITEHGLFSQAATGGGTLWDRSVFSPINVLAGDSILFTYTCTVSSGG